MNKHIGSSFDSFLAEEGIAAQVNAAAVARILDYVQSAMHPKAICPGCRNPNCRVTRSADTGVVACPMFVP